VILSLRQDFSSQNQKGFNFGSSDSFEKRLLLAEHEIDGIMRKRISYSVKDQGEERSLDYSALLN